MRAARADDEKASKPRPIVNIRSFGALGDGRTNDTDAFVRAANYLNRMGTGTLQVPPGVYIVGKQGGFPGTTGAGVIYAPSPILRIENCRGPILIEGLGDDDRRPILKAASGLRFGAFNPLTGAPFNSTAPFLDPDYQAHAYWGMIELRGNADVTVRGFELDGNQDQLSLGGVWGDTGRQCAAYGLYCNGNAKVAASDIYTHDHGLDGVIVSNPFLQATDARPHKLVEVVSDRNGRNAFSWVGGSGLTMEGCKGSRSGRGRVSSAPGAGIDIEPEDTHMAGGLLHDCQFLDNVGVGVSADGANTATASVSGVTLRACNVFGTTYYSTLIRKPGFLFDDCRIVGSLVVGADLPANSIVFEGCDIGDSHPRAFAAGLLVDANSGACATFKSCSFAIAKQKIGTFVSAVRDSSFHVLAPPTLFPASDWIATFYHGEFVNCSFVDAFPGVSQRLAINYGANPAFSGNTIAPTGSRLYFSNQG